MPMIARPFARLPFAALFALALAAAPAPAQAQAQDTATQDTGQFDFVVTGVTAGTLTYSASRQGTAYTVSARFASTGLVAVLRRIRVDARTDGTIRDGRPSPARYQANADFGRRNSDMVMDYADGVPQTPKDTPPRDPEAWDIAASTQPGTVDPLTALFTTLRDTAPGTECNIALRLFDGRRATELTVGPPQPSDGGAVTCTGEYRRIAGYPPEDLAEKSRFPFTLILRPTATGQMRVMEVEMDSLLGRARLIRR